MQRETLRRRLIDRIDAPVAEKQCVTTGIQTCYLEAGSGPAVVLLHGASAAAGIGWYPVIGPLSRAFRVITPDCPGHGESDKPVAAYDTPFFRDWLDAFLDALDLPSVSLVGLSQGGAIALKYTLQAPDRVERLALVDSAGLTSRLPLGFVFGLVWANLFPSKRATRWLMRYVVADPESLVDGLLDLGAYGGLVASAPNGRRVLWRGRGRATRAVSGTQLRRVTQPTLLLWGEYDRIFPVEVAKAARQRLPNARLYVVPGAGHVPFFERREAFLGALAPFLLGDLEK